VAQLFQPIQKLLPIIQLVQAQVAQLSQPIQKLLPLIQLVPAQVFKWLQTLKLPQNQQVSPTRARQKMAHPSENSDTEA
jgi:hypothetical protein